MVYGYSLLLNEVQFCNLGTVHINHEEREKRFNYQVNVVTFWKYHNVRPLSTRTGTSFDFRNCLFPWIWICSWHIHRLSSTDTSCEKYQDLISLVYDCRHNTINLQLHYNGLPVLITELSGVPFSLKSYTWFQNLLFF